MEDKLPQVDHQTRSEFIRGVVQSYHDDADPTFTFAKETPKTIVQFWDDLNQLPTDVKECVQSWQILEVSGFEIKLFDDNEARSFIAESLGSRYENAYGKCYHPAMKSDYFRLCYILVKGGCYLDADDVYNNMSIHHLFADGRLRIQPLCYDILTNEMIPPSMFLQPGAYAPSWIFYFNNNPLIAARGHPLVERSLASATGALERSASDELLEIQSTTGPGNLTKSIFDHANEGSGIEDSLCVLRNWEDIATSRWPLSYRCDSRNWRISNQQYRV